MGERNVRERRAAGQPPGRLLAAGTTGFALAITLLMVLSPMSAGASVHPATVLKAPYKGTASSPSWYGGTQGCGTAKGSSGKWTATTGVLTGSSTTTAKTCGKVIGYVGGYNSGYWSSSVEVAVPIKILTTANHSIGVGATVTSTTTYAYNHGACPTKLIHYPPAYGSYQYAYCEAGVYVYWELYASLVDLSNSSWYKHNYTYVEAYNDSYYQNYTDCYNYGTVTCYNTTGNHSYHGPFGYNAPGYLGCSLSGSCSFTLWTNSTAPMPRTDRWAVIVSLYMETNGYASSVNVAGAFLAAATASMNLATLGNGAKITSVTIV